MSSAEPRVEAHAVEIVDIENRVFSRVVGILCDARLATLAMTVISAAAGWAGWEILIVLLAIPFSWFPLRYWQARGTELMHSRTLLLCDVLMTVIVSMFVRTATDQVYLQSTYLVVSIALWALLLGPRIGVGLALGAAGCLLVWDWLISADVWMDALFLVPAGLGVAWLGHRLGETMRSQAQMALHLVSRKAEQAALSERVLLAREMHDSLAKTVHGVSLLAKSLAVSLERDRSAHVGRAVLIHEACDEAILDTREILSGLRALSHESLAAAVRLEVTVWQERSGILVDVAAPDDDDHVSVPADVSWATVRVLGELLENSWRHAQPHRVSVTLELDDTLVRLTVSDDGRGIAHLGGQEIDVGKLALGGHYGLIGVQERVRELDGSLRLTSRTTTPSGTSVVVEMPLLRGAEQLLEKEVGR